MPRFLIRARYSAAGVQGLIEDGGTDRSAAVRALYESLGGRVESFYFALGDVDAYAVVDMPDTVSAVAVSLTVAAAGFVALEAIPLVTPEEVDAATRLSPAYDAPGRFDN